MASASVVMLLQTLFAVLTVAVIMWVARRLFGDRTANLAGVLWAESVPLLWMPILFWETSLSILLLTGMVALALRCVEKSSARLWAVIGVYCGLAMLVNPALLLAMLAVCCWAAYRTRSSSLYGPLMGLFVMLVVFAPWPIRNARVMHAFIPLRSSFGYELWQGNRAGADGVFDGSLYPANSKLEFADYASKGELAYMREKSALAKAYIRAHPSEFIWLTAKRAARFWMGRDGKIDSIPMELYMATISLLGLLGLVTLFIKHRPTSMLFLLPLLVFPLPYYITDMKFRYRLTIDPLLTILVAYAVIQLSAYVNKKRMTIV
jgi:4-amino-4-deoxy-L-arabinose transferase-like glycosyltransferase